MHRSGVGYEVHLRVVGGVGASPRVILLAAYAFFVWYLAIRYRRRWGGYVSVVAGVLGLQVGRFYRGALRLTVDYADVVPLTSRLAELDEFAPRAMTQRDDRTIEIRLPV